jgi:hypothetical protein
LEKFHIHKIEFITSNEIYYNRENINNLK